MAITTKAQLKTAAATWANRSNLTSYLDDLITIAEGRMNDLLILKNMETETTLTASISSGTIALPTGFISPIAMWLVESGVRIPLEPALPQEFNYTTSNSQPKYYAIDGVNVRFDCPCQEAYSMPMRYVKQSNLSADGDTNYLLTKRPDVYLAALLVEIARFIKDVELFNEWEPRFQKSVQELKASDGRNRGIVPLRTDIPSMRSHGRILTGDT
jgi:hypothetical protein